MSVRSRWWSTAFAAIALVSGGAHARLGGPRASIEEDRAHFSATMGSTMMGGTPVAMLRATDGGVIREYSNADGVVFAVTWRGRGRPDFRQLLGDRFETASADMAGRPGRHLGRLMTMRHPELVVRSQGRPGAFSGFAYDPRLVPAGFALDDLR